MKLSGWGRYPVVEAQVSAPRDEAGLIAQVRRGNAIARGNGRAYGDSAISPDNTIEMRHFNRLIAFDDASGQLVAEAGVLLADIIAAMLPRGWFPAVTPGTKFVTLGGMIAADVHGKNHHRDGSFGNFVDWIDLVGADGTVRRCSRDENAELFDWTLGGMGLTGIVLRAAFRLRRVESGWIRQSLRPAPDLAAACALFEEARDATYSVAWIDALAGGAALGRSLVMVGEHATRDALDARRRDTPLEVPHRRRLRVPFDAPPGLLNRLTVRAFNALYDWNGRRHAGDSLIDWDSYFYPLDSILGWNRIYGRRGFVQFQCVLPLDSAQAGLTALLQAIAAHGQPSFLAVLKRMGPERGALSFPMPGYTLALDFPASRASLQLMELLDRLTLGHGGRFYLAKDGRMRAETLTASDPRAAAFRALRARDPRAETFRSAQSERLKL
ncbi:FAD-binding oxidoreductase [Acidimangrovimonas pyrenivorans]|uniref:FAD-binding protein n=1 Tax=Acidimangrovimonas pyrenivorans TaxID=2030798 RepID=A0ABV7AE28_9RHOB